MMNSSGRCISRTLLKVLFLFVLFVVGAPANAAALSITQTLSTPVGRVGGAKPPLNQTLSFQQFNSVLENGYVGRLDNVVISVSGTVLSDMTLKNTGSTTVNLSGNIAGDMYLSLAGRDLIDLYSGAWASTLVKNVAPGVTAIRNDLGSTVTDETTLTSLSDLTLFTGTGLISFLAYTDFMTTTGTSGGSTDFETTVSTWAWEDVSLTYYYTELPPAPVPEPATLLLIGSGMGVLSFLGRKKMKKPGTL